MALMCYEIMEVYTPDSKTPYIVKGDKVIVNDKDYMLLNGADPCSNVLEIASQVGEVIESKLVSTDLWHYTVKCNDKEYTLIDDDIHMIIREIK